ncbi:TA system VapC family ribonuclease toxin [Blastococcus saxobsidens]|uniref:Ribonuclease VapC n=1 Tax=Blastococcus saxobsidens (strain DD2) TaxID=1146883 RepID=H6RVI3_BLASD|nr:TA system VapC family ribonuclease toxin [Blastococcus saxobsidens]CCG03258.1 Putative PIN domain nucleic acid-binding protein [Blastococcus saxobsidens DD2]
MILPDVNVLVYAFRREAEQHEVYAHWLGRVVDGADELALHDPVLAGFLRIVTNPRFLTDPAPVDVALDFVARLRQGARARWIRPGHQTWELLARLAGEDRGIRGNLVPDAHLAAVALTHGAQLATADRGFSRFPGLRWFDPAVTPG